MKVVFSCVPISRTAWNIEDPVWDNKKINGDRYYKQNSAEKHTWKGFGGQFSLQNVLASVKMISS